MVSDHMETVPEYFDMEIVFFRTDHFTLSVRPLQRIMVLFCMSFVRLGHHDGLNCDVATR